MAPSAGGAIKPTQPWSDCTQTQYAAWLQKGGGGCLFDKVCLLKFTYFSLYSDYVQCEGFALTLTFYLASSTSLRRCPAGACAGTVWWRAAKTATAARVWRRWPAAMCAAIRPRASSALRLSAGKARAAMCRRASLKRRVRRQEELHYIIIFNVAKYVPLVTSQTGTRINMFYTEI